MSLSGLSKIRQMLNISARQTILQNNALLRELIQSAIALGRCIIDAINACFEAGEPLPEIFEQHVRLLLEYVVSAYC
jgi:hypothetical protein